MLNLTPSSSPSPQSSRFPSSLKKGDGQPSSIKKRIQFAVETHHHNRDMKLHKPFHEDLLESQGEIRIFLGGRGVKAVSAKRDILTTKN
jgi:hypothetical protein